MKKTVALIGLLLATLLLAACGNDDAAGSGGGSSEESFNDADVTFAQGMIPHHEQAIAMADLALEPSANASEQVRDFAKDIKGAQGPEIQTMESWLEDWDAPTASSTGMEHGSGMMTQEQMAALTSATGADFDRQWLTLMIQHHQGAVIMADQVLTTTEDDAVERMAKAIVKTQKAEITAMQREL